MEGGPTGCDPLTFRIVLDVGHTLESEGATSARNIPEFTFNLRLAQRIEDKLKASGFPAARLMVTEGRARPSLFTRVAAAGRLHADLLLSIHHDSVPNKFLEDWDFDGKKSHFSDRFSGYSVFVSRENPDFRTSLRFADLVGKEMKAAGLQYAHQYTQAIMGRNQHELLNEDTGVYRYDELIVLRKTQMPAVLLEAGSKDSLLWIHIPAGMLKLLNHPVVNWNYNAEATEGSGGRKIYWPRGKTLGGSSSINGMLYVRGNPLDYNTWAQYGNRGWSYESVLPYFSKAEHFAPGGDGSRGRGGPLNVEHMREPTTAIICEARTPALPRTPISGGASSIMRSRGG